MRVLNRSSREKQQVEKILGRTLDDRFALAYRVAVPGYRNRVGGVLVGPHGLTVLAFAESEKRVRCLGDNWYVADPKTGNFLARPSPVKQVQQDARAIELFLDSLQLVSVVPADCAVLVPDPNMQVEYMQPAVPVFPANRIAEFAVQLAHQRELVEWRQADDVLKGLGLPPLRRPWNALKQAKPASKRRRKGGLQRWQILLLIGLAIADVVVLALGVAILLMQ